MSILNKLFYRNCIALSFALSVSLGAVNLKHLCRPLDVVILLDRGITESVYRAKSGAVTKPLKDALQSEAAPIIVSGAVLHNFFNKPVCYCNQTVHEACDASENSLWLNDLTESKVRAERTCNQAIEELQAKLNGFKSQREVLEVQFEATKDMIHQKIAFIDHQLNENEKKSIMNNQENKHIIDQSKHLYGIVPFSAYLVLTSYFDRQSHESWMNSFSETCGLSGQRSKLENDLFMAKFHYDQEMSNLASQEFVCQLDLERTQQSLASIRTVVQQENKGSCIMQWFTHIKESIMERIALLRSAHEISTASADTSFRFENWLIFKHIHAELYILVPKNYVAGMQEMWQEWLKDQTLDASQFLSELRYVSGDSRLTEQEVILGLAIDHNDIVGRIENQEDLMLALNQAWSGKIQRFLKSHELTCDLLYLLDSTVVDLNSFKELFTKYLFKNYPLLDPTYKNALGLFAIYMNGHGWRPSLSSINQNQVDRYHYCAGLNIHQWQEFLTFASDVAWYLHYVTCYGGGQTAEVTRKHLQESDSHLMVSSGSLTDTMTYASAYSLDFCSFFQNLRWYCMEKSAPTDSCVATHCNGLQRITDALASISEIYAQKLEQEAIRPSFESMPIALYPEFHYKRMPVVLTNSVALTDGLAQCSEQNNVLEGKKAIVFTDNEIAHELVVLTQPEERLPILISATAGKTIHAFSSLCLPIVDRQAAASGEQCVYAPFSRFLKEMVFHIMHAYQKVYCIHRLRATNDTGIEAFGNNFENIDCIYIQKETKHNFIDEHPVAIDGSIIIVTKEHRFYKSTWNPCTLCCGQWIELTNRQATQLLEALLS